MDSTRRIQRLSCVLLAMTFVIFSCSRGAESPEKKGTGGLSEFSCPAFVQGAPLPAKYTCEGENASPPLKWSGVSEGVQSLALVCEDPDAPEGSRVLWIVYNIPPSVSELSEGLPAIGILPNGAKQGTNDFKNMGYTGPCPPPGKIHRCTFKLYASDDMPKLPPGITKKDLIRSMEGHHLAERQLMATCQKK